MKSFTCAICFYILITLLYHNSLVSRKLCQLPETNFRGTLKGRYPDALEHRTIKDKLLFAVMNVSQNATKLLHCNVSEKDTQFPTCSTQTSLFWLLMMG